MQNSRLIINILITGLIAGTLDISAAVIILAGGNAVGTFKFIASGAFGRAALDGGYEMAALGLLFHYIIALGWSAIYFLSYPKLPFLKQNKWINALGYGIFVWLIMNLVILPFTQVNQRGFQLFGVLENMAILAVCIGLPVSLAAHRFYSSIQSGESAKK